MFLEIITIECEDNDISFGIPEVIPNNDFTEEEYAIQGKILHNYFNEMNKVYLMPHLEISFTRKLLFFKDNWRIHNMKQREWIR